MHIKHLYIKSTTIIDNLYIFGTKLYITALTEYFVGTSFHGLCNIGLNAIDGVLEVIYNP